VQSAAPVSKRLAAGAEAAATKPRSGIKSAASVGSGLTAEHQVYSLHHSPVALEFYRMASR